jgi:hypothetical protein
MLLLVDVLLLGMATSLVMFFGHSRTSDAFAKLRKLGTEEDAPALSQVQALLLIRERDNLDAL